MYILTAVVVLFCGITLINLVVTVGLVRRLRDGNFGDSGPEGNFGGLQPGDAAPDLGLPTEPGLRTFVGFFSTDCKTCPDYLPRFRARAAGFEGRSIAVVSGRAAKYEEYREALGPGILVAEHRGDQHMGSGPLISGFDVQSWPSFFLVAANGNVSATGAKLLDQPFPVVTVPHEHVHG